MRQILPIAVLLLVACGPETPEPNTATADDWNAWMNEDCENWRAKVDPSEMTMANHVCALIAQAEGTEANERCALDCIVCMSGGQDDAERVACYADSVEYWGCTLECYPPVA